jgi:hypothetical protein
MPGYRKPQGDFGLSQRRSSRIVANTGQVNESQPHEGHSFNRLVVGHQPVTRPRYFIDCVLLTRRRRIESTKSPQPEEVSPSVIAVSPNGNLVVGVPDVDSFSQVP